MQRNPAVALKLISSIAVPILTFGMEALSLTKSQRLSLDHPWNRTFMKIYCTLDKRIVQQCQHFGGFLPISLEVDIKRCEFFRKLPSTGNRLICNLSALFKQRDIDEIAKHYNYYSVNTFAHNFRNIIFDQFTTETNMLPS